MVLLVMLGSIEFYAQPGFSAIEINDVGTYEDLVGEQDWVFIFLLIYLARSARRERAARFIGTFLG